MIRIITLSFLLWITIAAKAQNIIAYTDLQGYFNIFDNGRTVQAETQPPTSFKTGGSCVAYIDYNLNFKIYYNGDIINVYDGKVSSYTVTHNLVLYRLGSNYYVFEKGKTTLLSNYVADSQLADSLVALTDRNKNCFEVYYKGGFLTLEDYYKTQAILEYKASNNTVAWLSYLREFKVFWNGAVTDVLTLPNGNALINYETGSNIVGFTSNAYLGLYAVYKGNVITLSNKAITDYRVGDDMIAYNDAGGFHVFYAGRNYDLNSFAPEFYAVEDSMLVYYNPGYLYVFNKGKASVLENFMPTEYAIDNNTFAYLDTQRGLKVFYNDETYQLSTFDPLIGFKIVGNAVWFSTQTVYNKVFLKGKTF